MLAVLPHGSGTVEVVEGGLEIPNDEGTDATVMAHAGAVVYLASDAASWVTGQLILVAGGRTQRTANYTPRDET